MADGEIAHDGYDVIVVGAGVVGPCVATALARQGRRVLIIEREWSKPNRIVGELMQPSGLYSLKQLGMIKAVNGIEAIHVDGYYISFYNKEITIPYPEKSILNGLDLEPVPSAIKLGNEDKMDSDSTLNMSDWDKSPNVKGMAFHHNEFLQNLRGICLAEENVTKLDGNVVNIVKDDKGTVIGVEVANKGIFKASLTICCDGIYSKFRKELGEDFVPSVGSYFVGLDLEDADLPAKNHGHVILGKHAPVLIYQVSPKHSRILCAYRSTTLPKKADVMKYLQDDVYNALPESVKPSFKKAMKSNDGSNVYRAMPNQYLTARLNLVPGYLCVGDSLNMRHPLTGGGMTVGLHDAVLLTKGLSTLSNEQLADHGAVLEKLMKFHDDRKGLDSVINTLSIALYSLFAADNSSLSILQKGCFHYFLRGGECVNGPIGLLSGMSPSPSLLFTHFFKVAFFSCWLNFKEKGIFGFPIALYQNTSALISACFVLLPPLLKELMA